MLDENILTQVKYKYSKKSMEAFFRNAVLNQLFNDLAGEIKNEGYQPCEARRENRKDHNSSQDSEDAKKKKGTIDFSKLSNEQVNALYGIEVDTLVKLSEVILENKDNFPKPAQVSTKSKGIKKSKGKWTWQKSSVASPYIYLWILYPI